MSKLTKKQKALVGKVDSLKLYALSDALTMVKEHATAKFDESIDVAVQLGIDAKKSDYLVRGAVVLDNGTGKTARVVRQLLPKAYFATLYAKPSGRPIVDTCVKEFKQNKWIHFPWDIEYKFATPIKHGGRATGADT